MGTIVGPGVYPQLLNVRAYANHILESRPGTVLIAHVASSSLHSIKRINDILPGAALTYTRIVGIGTQIYTGQTSFTLRQGGFSGNPLSFVDYRPVQSPETWCYIGDSNKLVKVRTDGTMYQMGIVPPLSAPSTSYGPPSYDAIDLFNETPPANWVASGNASTITGGNLINTTILNITYDQGLVGWASVMPNTNPSQGTGMFITLGSSATKETVMVDSTSAGLSPTTISSITYVSGSTGPCTIYPAASFNVVVGQLILIAGTEATYVTFTGTDNLGNEYFQTVTFLTHSPGDSLASLNPTYRVFLQYNHVAGEALTAGYFQWLVASTGTNPGLLSELEPFNLLLVQGRPQQPTTDVISFWMVVNNTATVTQLRIQFDDDPNTNNFSANYFYFDVGTSGFVAGTWKQVTIPINTFTHSGSTGLGWGGIKAVGITATLSSGSLTVAISSLSIYGQYGPNIGSTTNDYLYRYRWRSSITGAVSLPGPPQRTGLAAANQSIVVTGIQSSLDVQVDTADIYRFGGTLTNWIYVGSVNIPFASPTVSFYDDFADADIAANPLMTYDDFQPFPTVDTPHSGVCSVTGFTVTRVSGDNFNVLWAPGTVILINGVAQILYNFPASTSSLQIDEPAGPLTNVPWSIPQATLTAQPLPSMWGPYLNMILACGDKYQPGVLFGTKGNNPDSAPTSSTLEITTPSEPLLNGCNYGGYSYVFSSERGFALSQDYSGINILLAIEIPNSVGLYSQYGLCVGKNGMYGIWRTGIWRSTGGAQKMITDPDLTLLFPHDGQPGQAVTLGSVTFQPPDFSQTTALRLSWSDFHLKFDYIDINGQRTTLVYNEIFGRWGPDIYAFNGSAGAVIHYQEEAPDLHSNLIGGSDGSLYQESGAQDNGHAFTATIRMPQMGGPTGTQHCRDGYVGLLTQGTANLVVNVDGTDYSVSVASPAGTYQRVYTVLPALKGKTFEWVISSTSAWKMFIADTFFRQKSWAGNQYGGVQPFANLKKEL